jgi:PE family
MSRVVINPQILSAAADNLQSIGSVIDEQNSAATTCTAEVISAATDEVSALVAIQFSAHAIQYRAASAQAAMVRELMTATLQAAAISYAATETANAVLLS